MGDTHAASYQSIQLADTVAICDKNELSGQRFSAKFGCKWYKEFDEMLKCEEIDVIDICLPTYLHEEYTILAARNRKNIFCEKPVTISLDSLDRMLEEVRKTNVLMLVGQVVRFWPEYVKAKELLQAGEFGDIKSVYAARLSEHPAWSEWYRKPENSGGGLVDLHLHDIDYMYYLFGRVKYVYSIGEKNSYGSWNYVSTILTFETGNSATVEGIMEMTKGYPFTMELRITGDLLTYQYEMKAGANLEDVTSARRESTIFTRDSQQRIPLDDRDAYHIELDHFVHCMDNGIPSHVIDMNQVRDVLCIISAIKKSLETNEKMYVEYESLNPIND